jgi:hypothetical protein
MQERPSEHVRREQILEHLADCLHILLLALTGTSGRDPPPLSIPRIIPPREDIPVLDNLKLFSELEESILHALAGREWKVTREIAEVIHEQAEGRIRGVLANLVERGAIEADSRKGYRLALDGRGER